MYSVFVLKDPKWAYRADLRQTRNMWHQVRIDTIYIGQWEFLFKQNINDKNIIKQDIAYLASRHPFNEHRIVHFPLFFLSCAD